jgi:hypothetical protein
MGTERKKAQWESSVARNSKTFEPGCPKGEMLKLATQEGEPVWRVAHSKSFLWHWNRIKENEFGFRHAEIEELTSNEGEQSLTHSHIAGCGGAHLGCQHCGG